MNFEDRMAKFEKALQYEPDYLPEYFVWWDRITKQQLEQLDCVLESATKESNMQIFLQENPFFLIQHLGGGHGRWVIPQKRLGAEFVPDFIVGERHSFGFEWEVIEIESPLAQLFTKAGNPSSTLNHAIRQIMDWRAWLKRNQNYASQRKEANGLGLTDIDCNTRGLIVIGRRNAVSPKTNELRRQLCLDSNIEIHTYDWLVERALGRIKANANDCPSWPLPS